MIRIERVARRFGPRLLFEELDWTIPAAARLGLVGPNGAGKTTLLRLIAGRDEPDAGRVHRPAAARIGYLTQEVETVEAATVLGAVLAGLGELGAIERELEAFAARMARTGPDDPGAALLAERYGALRERFEALDGDRAEARAKAILTGLGVAADRLHAPLASLSGGWRMRVVLARLLLCTPDLLLLDEPTNHLDLDAIEWLEGFLQTFPGAFVVVSHDRHFLNRTVRGVVELEGGRLTSYVGAYDAFLEERERRLAALEKAGREQQRELAQVERFIERFRYKASKARQVQARVKALGKVERVQIARRARTIRFGFPPAPRSGETVVRVEGVAKRFGSRVVFSDLDLVLRRGDRVALVGANGAGKSTFLRLVAGTLTADRGTVELGHAVRAHYYAQHQLDALDPTRTVLEELETVAAPGEGQRLRNLLGAFLFRGDEVDKPVAVLSGGEKARLALAKMLTRPANLLLLDEPTNHLDLPGREVLEDALDEYDGTLVVVSHDRYFINRVATSIATVGGGAIELEPGDYDAWIERRARRSEPEPGSAETAPPTLRGRREEARRREAEDRNRRYRERRVLEQRLGPVEAEIAELERRVVELELAQADPALYRDAATARETARERSAAADRLAALYAEWERIAAEAD